MNVIYELSIIGDSYKDPHEKNKTGIYRVAEELLKKLEAKQDINFFYSNSGSIYSECENKDIDSYLLENNYSIPSAIIRQRRGFLPFRKEKFFRKIYRLFGISNYTTSFNQELLAKADIYHSVFYPTPPIVGAYPNIKKLITIHDLIPLLFPEINSNTQLLKSIIQDIEAGGFAICVSENTKKDLLHFAPQLNPNRVFVSYLAASKDLFYPCKNNEKFLTLQAQYQLPDKYFLSLGTLEPRKNIEHVMRSFIKMIKDNNIDDLYLVLVGAKGWQYDNIFKEYDNSTEKDKIIFTGRLPDTDLASIYSHALAFYYMSIYEGFGLPPLEAMQCGVPVVVSDTSSLPEVVGEAGIKLPPKDTSALCEVMRKLYFEPELRAALSQKSLQQARLFSWEKTAEEHRQIYQKIIDYPA